MKQWNLILEYFSEICPENSSFITIGQKKTGTTGEDEHTFLIMFGSVHLRMISDKRCRGNRNTFHVYYFFKKNRAVYEIIWKNIVEWGRPQITIWLVRIACWIHKAKNTHSQYVTIIAFPLQQRLHERTSMLRLYVHWMSCFSEVRTKHTNTLCGQNVEFVNIEVVGT